MRSSAVLLALVVILGGRSPAAADESRPAPADPARIDKLIKDLGSAKFAERARARQELKRMGAPALEALRKAQTSEDAETRRAASDLAKGIEAEKLTANLLEPRRVKLNVRDMPVADAVRELARQSGYPIVLQGNPSALRGKKVTLNTGETTFWEAFDRLCREAGLVEVDAQVWSRPLLVPPGDRQFQKIGTLPVIPPPVPPAPKGFRQPAGRPAPPPAGGVLQLIQEVPQVQANGAVLQVQVPIQIQVQPVPPGQAVPPPLPLGGITIPPSAPSDPGQFAVQAGKPQKLPTCYYGGVRIRALPPDPGVKTPEGQTLVNLQVTLEPRLQKLGFVLTGTPQLKKVLDDQGQTLTAAPDPSPGGRPKAFLGRVPRGAGQVVSPPQGGWGLGGPTVLIRLQAGKKPAKLLKEFAGSLTAQVRAPAEALLKVNDVLKAAGKSAKGEHGGTLQVVSIHRGDNGDFHVDVRLENVPGIGPFGGLPVPGARLQFQQIQIQAGGGVVVGGLGGSGGTFAAGMPSLVDAKGKAYQLVQVPRRGLTVNNNVVSENLTLVFRADASQGPPASLVVTGQRMVTVQIPFHLEDVRLP